MQWFQLIVKLVMAPIFVVYLCSAMGIRFNLWTCRSSEFKYSRNFCCYKTQFIFKGCMISPLNYSIFSVIFKLNILEFHILKEYQKLTCIFQSVWRTLNNLFLICISREVPGAGLDCLVCWSQDGTSSDAQPERGGHPVVQSKQNYPIF